MQCEHQSKRRHFPIRGRGVTAAQQTFNLSGGGSNPSGPNDARVYSSMVRAGLLEREQGPAAE